MKMSAKPVWPYPQIVTLTPHPRGYWVKKINGKQYSFGPLAFPDVALAMWQSDSAMFKAGKTPKHRVAGHKSAVTVSQAANAYLSDKSAQVLGGDLRPKTWADLFSTARRVVSGLGGDRAVNKLGPADFTALRTSFALGGGPFMVEKAVVVARMIFRYAYDNELIDDPVRFGDHFKRPGRVSKRRTKRALGPQVFEAKEIRALLDLTKKTNNHAMRSMILLGINGAFGPTDCGRLLIKNLDMIHAIPHVIYPRPKTEVERVIPLWPETVTAIRLALNARPIAVNRSDDGLAFLTGFGNPWVRDIVHRDDKGHIESVTSLDVIGQCFRSYRKRVGPNTPSFYKLRHTAITIADDVKDPHAAHRIRGHTLPGMSDVYVEQITLERLAKVTDHVRAWLFNSVEQSA
jgi:integrase